MHIIDLHVFLVVSNLKSFSKAAKLLHLSQPAVSHKINLLEEQLNTSLFERLPTGVSLTTSGETVFQYANEILQIYHEMADKLHEKTPNSNEKIIIGAEPLIADYFLPCKIWSFKEKFPQIEIKLLSNNHEALFEQLEKEEIDFVFTSGSVPSKYGFKPKLISSEPLYLAVLNNKNWDGIDELPIEYLYQSQVILPNKNCGIRRAVEGALDTLGIRIEDLNISSDVNSISAVISLIEAGYGVSVLSELACKNEVFSKTIKLIKIKSIPLYINFYLVQHDGKLNSLHTQFIDHINKIIQLQKTPE